MAEADRTFRERERSQRGYARVVAAGREAGSGMTTRSIEALLDAADVRSGSRVLDLSTGAGCIAAAAARRGAEVIGVDASAAKVRLARERYPVVRFEEAEAAALPFDPGSFDAVVDGSGMCRAPDPDAALREAYRVLKPGGRVAYTVRDVPGRATGRFGSSAGERSRQALLAAGFVAPCWRQSPATTALAAAFKPWRVTPNP